MLQLPAQSNKVPLEMTSQSVSQSVIVNPPTTFKIKSDLDAKYYVPDINIELPEPASAILLVARPENCCQPQSLKKQDNTKQSSETCVPIKGVTGLFH
jgi:hypothetical protein